MVKIGEAIKCPKCGNYGRVVWVSKDEHTVGVRCASSHRFTPRRNVTSAPTDQQVTVKKNSVFLVSV